VTVPTRREAAGLLLSLKPSERFLRHACAVADVAGWLASRIEARGTTVDRAVAESAALLHDVDKLPSVGRAAGVRHGDGSAAWLTAHGMPELAAIVLDHPVTRLGDEDDAARLAAAPLEARIVAYADKRAAQHLQAMDERFAGWQRRGAGGGGGSSARMGRGRNSGRARPTKAARAPWSEAELELLVGRARDLEREICDAAGVTPSGVRRLRWSRRALREAAR
jgi:hypothetical protein